ncbi:MAG: UDP-N-acetylmuramoyl-tripeptide--D-alanyl-D-alanine ligase [Anaerovoracaceae bacterium]|jgi:UDP-N-acetylmuramoyl-tripeptide--D-alanyl-D-alanine ligase
MKNMSINEILEATQGALIAGNRDNQINGVFIDSRIITPKTMFVAIPGERVDGHDYIIEAIKKGCTAVLISSKRDEATSKALEKGTAIIRVEDTVVALQQVAAYYLNRFNIKKVGVTGSVGKTTTKEMLYCILSEKYNTVRNPLNYNNAIGLPLSIFNVEEQTEAAVFEMGMDCLGEIHRLAELVHPNVAVITNVGVAHLERLGSRENILKAKMEIVDFLESGDTLVINGDDELLSKTVLNGPYRVLRVGGQGEIQLDKINDMGEEGVSFTLCYEGKKTMFSLSIPGRHNAINGAIAVGAALTCGVSMEEAVEGLKKFRPADKRGFLYNGGGIKIIDDSYNANPQSMRAAIDMLSSVKGGRRIAILGDMGELGKDSEKFHLSLGEYIKDKPLDILITVGELSRFVSMGAAGRIEIHHFRNKEDFHNEMVKLIKPDDIILVKGSRFMEMEKTVEQLKWKYTEED